MKRYFVFDTTLRDGEQMIGVSLNRQEKLEIALQLARLNVDVIEAGFPVVSKGDADAVKTIAQSVHGPVICALSRAVKKDIDAAWQAIKYSASPRIHIVIATSNLHMRIKLNKTPQEVLALIRESVSYAFSLCNQVQFSAEDATRSDPEFLALAIREAIDSGASVINLPDTVGYALPENIGAMFETVQKKVPALRDVVLSIHCHNDLGLAVANSIAALQSGATQVECTINGMGERTGNAALDEIAMITSTRKELGVAHKLDTTQLYRTSGLVSHLFGQAVPVNKPIVGKNAFLHSAGIHQHGVIQDPGTYEIMKPEDVGMRRSEILLGKHSGRHALEQYIGELGYSLAPAELDMVFGRFKQIADKKKEVSSSDIEALLRQSAIAIPHHYELGYFHILGGNTLVATATVQLKNKTDETIQEAACGDGPIDAIFHAIQRAVNIELNLIDYSIRAVSGGTDALGEATVKILHESRTYIGRGISMDIMQASARAYINAINRLIYENGRDSEITDQEDN